MGTTPPKGLSVMKQIPQTLKNLFQNKIDFILLAELLTLFIITFGFLIYIAYTNTLNGDEREHVYASYLVYNGYIPYRDFFEHHHPLLWYLFQPVIHFFINSANIWYAARTFSLILIVINCIFLFKTSKLLTIVPSAAWITIILSICPHCVFLSETEFRPDTPMITFFVAGLYYYLKATKNPSDSKNLSISFTLFFLALAALQKICFLIAPFALLTIFLLYKRIFTLKSILKALILPFICTSAYVAYLYTNDALKDYFELNWLLNAKVHFNMQYPIHQTSYYYIANLLAISTLFTAKPSPCKYLSFICVCLSIILEFILRGAFLHYWLPLYPLFALICSYYIAALSPKIKIIALACLIYTITINNLQYKKNINQNIPLNHFVYLTQNILELSQPNDYIIGCIGSLGGLRLDATGYYWFGRNYIALLDNHYFKRHELPNGDRIVKTRHPKIVCAEDWTHCMTDDHKFTLDCHSVPTYDRDYLEQHYNNMGFIYVRK